MRTASRTASKGFTLIELAVVIAIVAILAAVAVPRLMNVTDSAQEAVARDLTSQLTSAMAMYTADQMAAPTGFNQFVTTGAIAPGSDFTLSLQNVGTGGCTVAANTVDCSSAFSELTTVQYNFNGGAITPNITP